MAYARVLGLGAGDRCGFRQQAQRAVPSQVGDGINGNGDSSVDQCL
jgi:hypothetical protein